MSSIISRTAPAALALLSLGLLAGCNDDASSSPTDPNKVVLLANGISRQYGKSVAIGNGKARTYIMFDQRKQGRVTELGVALTPDALEGLPAPMTMPPGTPGGHEHPDMHQYTLPLPTRNSTEFKFLELDWNPQGHEVQGVYTVPHFDFHFYTISPAERDQILPSDPEFQQKADNYPSAELIPQFYSTLTPPGAQTAAVPQMGVHWIDVRSPEMQALLGHPELAKPFTTTFLFGSWNGRFTFAEPMVTRDFILGRRTAATAAQRDSVMALPVGAQATLGASTPVAYRVAWDAQMKEYRIAMKFTQTD